MSVICIVCGGLQRSATDGIRQIVGDNALNGPLDTVVSAPVSGLIGVRGHAGQTGAALFIPAQATGTDCPAFPAGGRTWVAVHAEIIPETLAAANTNSATYALLKLVVGAHRDLQLLMVLGAAAFSVAAHGTTTFTTTSVTDTAHNFVTDGAVVGDFVMTTTGVLLVTSISTTTNPNDTLNGAAWHMVSGTSPSAGVGYSVYHAANVNYKWRITDGTTNWDSSARACTVGNTTPFVIDFQWQLSTTGASNKVALWVNNVLEINPASNTGGAAAASPFDATFWMGTDDVTKGNVWPEFTEFYNVIFYDDVAHTGFDTFPLPYSATATARPLVTFRPPLRGGIKRYDAWTKSSGTDAAAVLDDHPNVDQATKVTATATNDMQSWECVDTRLADCPVYGFDTIYAVQSVGNCSIVGSIISMGQSDGVSNDDAGRRVRGSLGQGQMLWCNYLDPAGNAWTYMNANRCQSWAKCVSFGTSASVFDAGQMLLFIKGTARSLAPPRRRNALIGR